MYAVLHSAEKALRHARRCLQIVQAHPEDMEDWDEAFAQEVLARAHAVAGNEHEMNEALARACERGAAIAEDGDMKAFWDELRGGDGGSFAPDFSITD